MSGDLITISGTGCALADFLYTNVRFNDAAFLQYESKNIGDGGLSPGRLVFTEELERFSGKPYQKILQEITGGCPPDTFNIGGPGLVSLIHAAQLLQNNGYRVKFFGSLGKDETALKILSKASGTPLDISQYKQISDKPTPFTDVLSDPSYDHGHGERTFVNNIGAAWDYTPSLVSEDFLRADIACFGGTALVPHVHDALSDLLARVKAHKGLTVVNTVYDFRNEKAAPGKPWPLGESEKSYGLIDVLLMDLEESLKISGCSTMPEAIRFFRQKDVACFVITNGANDLVACSNGSLFEKSEPAYYPITRLATNVFRKNGDTTGCGDNFAGGFIASLAKQLSEKERGSFNLREAIALAVASGGFATSYKGGTYTELVPGEKWQKVLEFYNDYLLQISKASS